MPRRRFSGAQVLLHVVHMVNAAVIRRMCAVAQPAGQGLIARCALALHQFRGSLYRLQQMWRILVNKLNVQIWATVIEFRGRVCAALGSPGLLATE